MNKLFNIYNYVIRYLFITFTKVINQNRFILFLKKIKDD